MIIFETQKDFEEAVREAVLDTFNLHIETYGYPFVFRVAVALTNKQGDKFLEAEDAVN